ncbi:unnamed protein product, partial [Callosobruchus maculatus]
ESHPSRHSRPCDTRHAGTCRGGCGFQSIENGARATRHQEARLTDSYTCPVSANI